LKKQKILKLFYIKKAHPLTSLMIVRSLNVKKDHVRPSEEGEEFLGPKVPLISVFGVLTYFANCT